MVVDILVEFIVETGMTKSARLSHYRNQIILGFAITLVIYIAVVLILDNTGQLSGDVYQQFGRFRWEMLIPLMLCQIFAIFFRFLEWHYYLGVIGARHKISLADSLIIFTTGFVFVVSPAKVAEILKSVFLKVKTDVPIAVSAPIIIAERVVDGIAVIILMVIALLVGGDRIPLGDFSILVRTIVYGSALILALGLIVVQIKPLAYGFIGLIGYVPLLRRLRDSLQTFYESSREIFKLKHVIPMTMVGVMVYGVSALSFLLVLLGFGLEFSWILALYAAFIVGIASAIGALSFVPNGAGVTEVSNVALMLAIITPSHPLLIPTMATTIALVDGFFHKWFRVLVGLLVGFYFRDRLFTRQLSVALAELEIKERDQLVSSEAI